MNRIFRPDIRVRVIGEQAIERATVRLSAWQLIRQIGLFHPATVGIIRNRVRREGLRGLL
jgi:hypothetical protein